MTKDQHTNAAKRLIAQGDAAFAKGERGRNAAHRKAAAHIAAALKAGDTQTEVATKVGRSQPWVSLLMKWRAGGFKGSSPFEHHHSSVGKLLVANNSAEPEIQTVSVPVTYKDVQIAAPYTVVPMPEPKVVHLQISRGPSKAPIDYSEEVAAVVPMLGMLARLDQVVSELETEIQIHGGIVGAGADVQSRVENAVSGIEARRKRLSALADHRPKRQAS